MSNSFKVPIRNVFYLLSYANDLPEMVKSLNQVEDDLLTFDFLVEQFNREVQSILHKGLVRNYVSSIQETSNLSGRLLLSESMPYIMRRKPIVVCEKNEYSEDVLLNQIMKATLERIQWNNKVNEKNKRTSFHLREELYPVSECVLTKEIFLRMKFHRHNMYYKRMIHIAYLLFELDLLSHQSGEWSLFNAEIDDQALNTIFEKFLFNFYRLEQREYWIQSERLGWNLKGNRAYLPGMLTDVSLTYRVEAKKIVIDAKYYKHMFQVYRDKTSFHSANMYQLFTYLQHQPMKFECVRGILIYPYNGVEVNEIYHWDERMTMEVMTIDLGAKWVTIKETLLQLL
ncbi:hypothetical protein SPD48_04975 [Pseudogracilibacillus sp. SE30717A]|uniref:5-methylcytosine restriction system specificity protein McrC n=1 Tax=Pseudogracilibacillus sp. SE30717A TaxID=3098293 RepID=UPI00300E2847